MWLGAIQGRQSVAAFLKVSLFAVALSACQSGGDAANSPNSTAIGMASEKAGSRGPFTATQTLGKGDVKVAMLLPLSAAGEGGEKGRKMRDAAVLAMRDLGEEWLTLSIDDTGGDEARATGLAAKATGAGARVIIGPTELAATQHLARISGTKKPIVLALADNFSGGTGVYSVRLGEADSAAAGAAALAETGKRKFVLLAAEGSNSGQIEKRVANSLSIYGASLAVALPYGPVSGGIEKRVDEMAALVAAPEAIVIASGGASPAPVLAALKARGLLKGGIAIVGTNRWLERPLNDPLLEGAYIATLDGSEIGPIAERFRTTFRYEPNMDAAYAYDMVALTAGIASSTGPNGMKREVFETSSGFRGSTGIFRFRADGASERSMPFYRVQKGRLKLIEKSTASF